MFGSGRQQKQVFRNVSDLAYIIIAIAIVPVYTVYLLTLDYDKPQTYINFLANTATGWLFLGSIIWIIFARLCLSPTSADSDDSSFVLPPE
jgi:hypothetical protein